MSEIPLHKYECGTCQDWIQLRGFRIDSKKCQSCGSHDLHRLTDGDIQGIKIKTFHLTSKQKQA